MTNNRNDFEQRLDAELTRLETRIDLAKARIEVEKADAAAKLRTQLAALEGQRSELRSRLAKLKESGDEAWEEASRGAAKAWSHLKAGYDEFENALSNAFETVTS